MTCRGHPCASSVTEGQPAESRDEVSLLTAGRCGVGKRLRHHLESAAKSQVLGGTAQHHRKLAGLDDYGRKFISSELSSTEQLIVDLLGTAADLGMDMRPVRPSAIEQLETLVQGVVAPLRRFDDPKGVYAHCFCAVE